MADDLPEGWGAEEMRELGERHAGLEARGDLEGTMATLVDDPVYEFWPVGRSLRGRPGVERYYRHLFSSFIPSTRSYKLVAEWVSASALAQEYEIEVDADGSVERHRVIGILQASGPLLGGERIYASERCLRLMLGDLFDELGPVEGRD